VAETEDELDHGRGVEDDHRRSRSARTASAADSADFVGG
jgi:hypothetical protein